jgi:hypothetical protein
VAGGSSRRASGALTAADVPARVDALLAAGIRQFVDLTEEGRAARPLRISPARARRARGLRADHRRFAIRDLGVPSPALMCTILDTIHDAMAADQPVYVHCWAGVGRTGTVIGCLLREHGLTASEALAVIGHKWQSMEKRVLHPRSPEHPLQFALIEAVAGATEGRQASSSAIFYNQALHILLFTSNRLAN